MPRSNLCPLRAPRTLGGTPGTPKVDGPFGVNWPVRTRARRVYRRRDEDPVKAGVEEAERHLAAVAQAWGTTVVPHVWGTGIGLAASLQYIATLPPTPLSSNPEETMLEYDRSSHPFREDLIHGAIRMVDGKVAVPQAPGIGVEIDRDILDRYGCQAH